MFMPGLQSSDSCGEWLTTSRKSSAHFAAAFSSVSASPMMSGPLATRACRNGRKPIRSSTLNALEAFQEDDYVAVGILTVYAPWPASPLCGEKSAAAGSSTLGSTANYGPKTSRPPANYSLAPSELFVTVKGRTAPGKQNGVTYRGRWKNLWHHNFFLSMMSLVIA